MAKILLVDDAAFMRMMVKDALTKNGYGDLVVMSIETYEEMLDCIAIDKAIADAEQEIAAGGQLLDAKEALASLRRKYFG